MCALGQPAQRPGQPDFRGVAIQTNELDVAAVGLDERPDSGQHRFDLFGGDHDVVSCGIVRGESGYASGLSQRTCQQAGNGFPAQNSRSRHRVATRPASGDNSRGRVGKPPVAPPVLGVPMEPARVEDRTWSTATTYLGLRLSHPFIAGASPLAANLDTVRRLEDAGCAALVMHSLFEEQITGTDDRG